MERTLRLLVLEDQPRDAEASVQALRSLGLALEVRRVESREDFVEALDRFQPEVILAEILLPGFSGIDALRMVRGRSLDVPFLFVTGGLSEESAIAGLKEGADDYVLKDHLVRLPAAAGNALRHREVEREREKGREALRQSEIHLRQATKMEAVGRLAGGVAHDFNNLLTAIVGYSDVALDRLGADHPARADIEEIRKAGERGAALTRQLLAFSRKQVVEERVLDLNAVVAEFEDMLRRALGEAIELEMRLAPGRLAVRADRGQIEQVLVNLAVNAREAMPAGGRLSVHTDGVELAEGGPKGPAGRYALLELRDTGAGMDKDVQAHLFEPFFSTKDMSRGTGLGLAAVYGIVTQSRGHVEVESRPGQGATFRIYLPRVEEAEPERRPTGSAEVSARTGKTVLLVEDEDPVRALIADVLKREGFEVLEANGPDQALELSGRHPAPIALLVTDMIMPGIRGSRLARLLSQSRPDMKVIFISGYIDDTLQRRTMSDKKVKFIQKPFRPEALLRKVRELLS